MLLTLSLDGSISPALCSPKSPVLLPKGMVPGTTALGHQRVDDSSTNASADRRDSAYPWSYFDTGDSTSAPKVKDKNKSPLTPAAQSLPLDS